MAANKVFTISRIERALALQIIDIMQQRLDMYFGKKEEDNSVRNNTYQYMISQLEHTLITDNMPQGTRRLYNYIIMCCRAKVASRISSEQKSLYQYIIQELSKVQTNVILENGQWHAIQYLKEQLKITLDNFKKPSGEILSRPIQMYTRSMFYQVLCIYSLLEIYKVDNELISWGRTPLTDREIDHIFSQLVPYINQWMNRYTIFLKENPSVNVGTVASKHSYVFPWIDFTLDEYTDLRKTFEAILKKFIDLYKNYCIYNFRQIEKPRDEISYDDPEEYYRYEEYDDPDDIQEIHERYPSIIFISARSVRDSLAQATSKNNELIDLYLDRILAKIQQNTNRSIFNDGLDDNQKNVIKKKTDNFIDYCYSQVLGSSGYIYGSNRENLCTSIYNNAPSLTDFNNLMIARAVSESYNDLYNYRDKNGHTYNTNDLEEVIKRNKKLLNDIVVPNYQDILRKNNKEVDDERTGKALGYKIPDEEILDKIAEHLFKQADKIFSTKSQNGNATITESERINYQNQLKKIVAELKPSDLYNTNNIEEEELSDISSIRHDIDNSHSNKTDETPYGISSTFTDPIVKAAVDYGTFYLTQPTTKTIIPLSSTPLIQNNTQNNLGRDPLDVTISESPYNYSTAPKGVTTVGRGIVSNTSNPIDSYGGTVIYENNALTGTNASNGSTDQDNPTDTGDNVTLPAGDGRILFREVPVPNSGSIGIQSSVPSSQSNGSTPVNPVARPSNGQTVPIPAAWGFVPTYNTFSGHDMVVTAQINLGGTRIAKIIGSFQTISYSVHNEKAPVRVLGDMNVRRYVFGPRTIAGSLIFTVFDKHWMRELLGTYAKIKSETEKYFLIDELPEMNLTISMANEYGQGAVMALYGVTIVNEGQVMSINDIYTENTFQYYARSIDYLDDVAMTGSGRKVINAIPIKQEINSSPTGETVATNPENKSTESQPQSADPDKPVAQTGNDTRNPTATAYDPNKEEGIKNYDDILNNFNNGYKMVNGERIEYTKKDAAIDINNLCSQRIKERKETYKRDIADPAYKAICDKYKIEEKELTLSNAEALQKKLGEQKYADLMNDLVAFNSMETNMNDYIVYDEVNIAEQYREKMGVTQAEGNIHIPGESRTHPVVDNAKVNE